MAWIKTLPEKSGLYFVATRAGLSAGTRCVILYGDKLTDVQALAGRPSWDGWWWSVPIEPPPDAPSSWETPVFVETTYPSSRVERYLAAMRKAHDLGTRGAGGAAAGVLELAARVDGIDLGALNIGGDVNEGTTRHDKRHGEGRTPP